MTWLVKRRMGPAELKAVGVICTGGFMMASRTSDASNAKSSLFKMGSPVSKPQGWFYFPSQHILRKR